MKNHTKKEINDVVIIGGGPAGMTAGIYTARAGLQTLILEREAPGGKMIKTEYIENYPGFEKPILGPDLSMNFYNQAINLGVEFIFNEVVNVKKTKENLFEIYLSDGNIIKAFAVILSTGTKENELGIPGEKELYGKGVSYCAICDGAFHKGKDVAIVGGGYSAIQEGIYLKKFVKKLYVIVRKDYFRADSKNVNKLKNLPDVEFLMETIVEKINGDNKVESISIKNTKTGKTQDLNVTAIFPYIGSTPVTKFVSDFNITDKDGYIIADLKMKTSIPGLFTAGDVREKPLRQIAIATGDGALAGQMAVEYLQELESK